MSSPANGTSKSSKKPRRSSKDETNGKSSNGNGESLLAPINSYEQTKIDSANKAYEDAKQSYAERLDNLKQKKVEFKQGYKQELIVHEKVKGLKAEGLSGNISEEQTYVRINDELATFKAIEQALQDYKQGTVEFLFKKKQKVLESVTDARRKRQVEINKQKKKRKTELDNPIQQEIASQQDPQEPQGSGVINQALLERELKRESQLKRAQILIDCFVKNKTALETAHDQYEEYLNEAKSPYESELYSFHVARVQKWIHIVGNRLHLYYKITTDEEEPEEFEQLHDGGYDLPYDIPGFETGKFDFYQNVIKDRPRIGKPKEQRQIGKGVQTQDKTETLSSKSDSLQSSRSTTPLSSVHSRGPDSPENMAKKWTLHYRDIPKFTGAPGEMGATHLIKLNDMSTLFDIQEPQNAGDDAQEIIDLFKTSLNGPARNWYELNIADQIKGHTLANWEEIKNRFLKYYNPAGSTIEQQMSTLDTLKWQPLMETIDQFAYKFGLMFKSDFGEAYTVAMFKKSLPNEYRERLMGVNTFTDVIQRVKEVQQFLGQIIPPPVQWTGYPMGWQNPNSQGVQYPYGGIMFPPGAAYPGQTPSTQGSTIPSFPPQGQAQATGQQPKMNFMAAKSVSFSPQLETVIGVKDALTDVAGEINALKSQFSNNLDTKLRQIREELKDSSSLRMKDDLQDFLHNQTKAMDRSIEKLVHVMDKQSSRRDREKDWDKNRSRDRDRNAGYRGSYRDYRDQSRSSSRDRYSRSPSRSPGYRDYRRDRDRDRDRNRDRDRDYRRDRSASNDGYESSRPRSGSGVRYNPNIICRYCQGKGHIQAKCPQLERDLKMGNQKINEMTIGKDQAMVMTEEAISELVKRISQQVTN